MSTPGPQYYFGYTTNHQVPVSDHQISLDITRSSTTKEGCTQDLNQLVVSIHLFVRPHQRCGQEVVALFPDVLFDWL